MQSLSDPAFDTHVEMFMLNMDLFQLVYID